MSIMLHSQPARMVSRLADGPIDLVGDIHGEIDALHSLLGALGYSARGDHPAGRRLVFLGDLCDRGPDSPAVIELVRDLIARDRAQCVLGNHELNLLRGDAKHGNRWHLDPDHHEQREEFGHSKPAPIHLKPAWHDFFLSLPLALERSDLRVAHASWHAKSIATLRASTATVVEAFEHYDQRTRLELEHSGIAAAADAEETENERALEDESIPLRLLENLAKADELFQMGNPIRVVTSGEERVTAAPFWANGKWRMCDRVQWWNEYNDDSPVIVGHYWRSAEPGQNVSGGKPELFDDVRFNEWCGPKRNVFCVDFSVGGRYRERARSVADFSTRLGAIRWPERQLVFDDGMTTSMLP